MASPRMKNRILAALPLIEIAHFCKRWHVHELAVFGSALRDDFNASSDVDVLVTFGETSEWGLFEHVQMQQELKTLFGRDVDLITKRGLMYGQNKNIRDEILRTAKVLFSEHEVVHVER